METGKRIAAGVLPICAKTGRILIVRRGLNQPKPGLWACFGGKFEEGVDKSPKENARREFQEESGYEGKFKISRLPLYVNRDTHSVFYTYVGIFEEEFTPDLESAGEAIDYGWFYLGETPEALLPGFQEALEKKHKTLKNIICFYSGKC
jgi:ADP-ribose pyrophosphatase YjhB (NUDIX family)